MSMLLPYSPAPSKSGRRRQSRKAFRFAVGRQYENDVAFLELLKRAFQEHCVPYATFADDVADTLGVSAPAGVRSAIDERTPGQLLQSLFGAVNRRELDLAGNKLQK